jgi:flagellar motility protein MotE (MotC chaperone)
MAARKDRLEEIKAKMTNQQRSDMADIISQELDRRKSDTGGARKAKLTTKSSVTKSKISGGLDADSLKEMYSSSEQDIRKLRLQKLEKQLSDLKGQSAEQMQRQVVNNNASRSPRAARSGLSTTNMLLMYGVVAFGVFKIVLTSGAVDASVPGKADRELALQAQAAAQVAEVQMVSPLQAAQNWTSAEKELLTELDNRRVELERRRQGLDRRESELKAQSAAIAERMAELRSLTTKLEAMRKERDQRYEARLEQLAGVYSSMSPQQAAPLVAKLDTSTALGLLQRMPGKRMGQILSLMDADRAIELTKSLTERSITN